MTLHILYEGSALCGLRGVPRDWPEGHRWVYVDELAKATCDGCKTAAGLLPEVHATGALATVALTDDQLSAAGAGMMEVLALELEAVERQIHVGEPPARLVEVRIRAAPATQTTPATRVTYVRRLALFCRAHHARFEQFDLSYGGRAGVRLVFALRSKDVPALFEVVKL